MKPLHRRLCRIVLLILTWLGLFWGANTLLRTIFLVPHFSAATHGGRGGNILTVSPDSGYSVAAQSAIPNGWMAATSLMPSQKEEIAAKLEAGWFSKEDPVPECNITANKDGGVTVRIVGKRRGVYWGSLYSIREGIITPIGVYEEGLPFRILKFICYTLGMVGFLWFLHVLFDGGPGLKRRYRVGRVIERFMLIRLVPN